MNYFRNSLLTFIWNSILDCKVVHKVPKTVHILWGVDIDELALPVYARICVLSVAVLDVHLHEFCLKVTQRLIPLGLREQVDVSAHHNDRGLGSPALDVLQPGLEAPQPLLPVLHVPQEQVQGAAGEEALVGGVILLLQETQGAWGKGTGS